MQTKENVEINSNKAVCKHQIMDSIRLRNFNRMHNATLNLFVKKNHSVYI